jgi:hypothetical protein
MKIERRSVSIAMQGVGSWDPILKISKTEAKDRQVRAFGSLVGTAASSARPLGWRLARPEFAVTRAPGDKISCEREKVNAMSGVF